LGKLSSPKILKARRGAIFAALRGNVYLGPYIVQLTAGLADRFYDHEEADRTKHRWVLLTGLSFGMVRGRYPFCDEFCGVPQAPMLNE
jgi:hypothetical protein